MNYEKFKNSKTYQFLKSITPLRKAKISTGKIFQIIFSSKMALHSDKILQKMFVLLIREVKPTSIIETGTYIGATTGFMAKHSQNIPIYTCEIDKINYLVAKKNLKKYKNVNCLRESSPKFLNYLLDNNLL